MSSSVNTKRKQSGFDGERRHHEIRKVGVAYDAKQERCILLDEGNGWPREHGVLWKDVILSRQCVSDGKALLIVYVKYIANGGRVYPGISQLDGISIKKWKFPACEEIRCKVLSKSVERYGVMKIYSMRSQLAFTWARDRNLETGEIVDVLEIL